MATVCVKGLTFMALIFNLYWIQRGHLICYQWPMMLCVTYMSTGQPAFDILFFKFAIYRVVLVRDRHSRQFQLFMT